MIYCFRNCKIMVYGDVLPPGLKVHRPIEISLLQTMVPSSRKFKSNVVFHKVQYSDHLCIYIIYVNDLHTVCNHSLPILFAGDANLFLNGKKLDNMQILLNEELTEIGIWLKANKLSLNIKTIHYMLFENRGVTEKDICLKIENEPVTQVRKTKYFGVTNEK